MVDESKFFYINTLYSSSPYNITVAKWNKFYFVDVNETAEHLPYISITIEKYELDKEDIPKSTKYQKVKPILKELFLDYYFLTLKTINGIKIKEGEFYIITKSKDWFQIEYFSTDEKNKQNIQIDFIDSIEYLSLTILKTSGYKGRVSARKNGNPISIDQFKQFLNLTIKFLYDPDSYKVYLESYIKSFYKLAHGDISIVSFDLSSEKSFAAILEQLEARKTTIEKRLMEVDSDLPVDRTRLRGELDGINYAISTIQINK